MTLNVGAANRERSPASVDVQPPSLHQPTALRVLKGWNGPIAAIREIRISADNSCRNCDKQALCSVCPAMFMADSGVADQKSDYICRTTHALFEGIRDSVGEMLERPS